MKDYTLSRDKIAELGKFLRTLHDKLQADRIKVFKGCSAAHAVVFSPDGRQPEAGKEASSTSGVRRRGRRWKRREKSGRAENRRDRGEVSRTSSEVRREPKGKPRRSPLGYAGINEKPACFLQRKR